ncbi:MAG: DUF4397 domain-containing protein [Flavobacteriales bacterium]
MKKIVLNMIAPLALFGSIQAYSQARIQVIHNSADAAAAVVDIWVNNSILLLDDFAFREASPWVDAPAGVPITVDIKAPDSDQNSPIIASFPFTLDNGVRYVIVANGIVSPTGYNPATPFNLHVYPMGQEASGSAETTDVLVFHGATDAPTVDVFEVGVPAGQIVNDLAYSEFQGYLALPTLDFRLQVRDQTGSISVAEFAAPLATLGAGGASVVVFASGFLNPANNSNGPAFGLFAALADGTVLELPGVPFTPATIEFIHNVADAAAAEVDVYINGALALDNFAFRTSSGFVPVPVPAFGTTNNIRICPPNSTDDSNFIVEFSSIITTETYVVVVNGIASPSGYTPAPAISLDGFMAARETGENSANTDILIHHGSTDAGPVAVNEATLGNIIPNFAYTDFESYISLPANENYTIQIRDVAQTTTIASYVAPLNTLSLGGAAITVVASGFLNPANNSNGPAFGLFVSTGTAGPLLALPLVEEPEMVNVQIIHNSADAAAATVDVWLDNELLINDFAFRTATPFTPVMANTQYEVRISPANSTDTTGSIKKFVVNFPAGNDYIVVANGIASPSGYSPAPELTLHVFNEARLVAGAENRTDIVVYHGSTDAPTVDIFEASGPTAARIIDDLSYSEFSDVLELPTLNYIIQVRDESGENVVASYQAPLATLGLGGASITVLASGFLNPANNSNGPAFGLWVATPAGGELIPLPISVNVQETAPASFSLYPNPANEISFIEMNLEKSEDVVIRVKDMQGRVLATDYKGIQPAGFNRMTIDTNKLNSGVYFVELLSGNRSTVNKLVISK